MDCSVVNGALEYLSKDLGFADNTVLQGEWIKKMEYKSITDYSML
jgi:hypothetical protein